MRGSKWSLGGKCALITGAAGGIGAAVSQLLAARQAHLSLIDVRGDALRQFTDTLGGKMLCQEVDITQPDALHAAVAATIDHFGHLDVAIVNAGVVSLGSVERCDPRAFERVLAVNLASVMAHGARRPAAYYRHSWLHPIRLFSGRNQLGAAARRI